MLGRRALARARPLDPPGKRSRGEPPGPEELAGRNAPGASVRATGAARPQGPGEGGERPSPHDAAAEVRSCVGWGPQGRPSRPRTQTRTRNKHSSCGWQSCDDPALSVPRPARDTAAPEEQASEPIRRSRLRSARRGGREEETPGCGSGTAAPMLARPVSLWSSGASPRPLRMPGAPSTSRKVPPLRWRRVKPSQRLSARSQPPKRRSPQCCSPRSSPRRTPTQNQEHLEAAHTLTQFVPFADAALLVRR